MPCPFCNVSLNICKEEDAIVARIVVEKKQRIAKLSEGLIVGEKYKILNPIGAGGMGDIYRCECITNHEIYAIKILNSAENPNQALQHQRALKRFKREAILMSKLKHPNIIQIYDAFFDTQNQTTCIVMEYIKGKTLEELIQTGPMKEKEILHIAKAVTSALIKAEENNIVHRDIKPSNIMITRKGQVKLADFGIGKMKNPETNAATMNITIANTMVGTPVYASPEQLRSADTVDSRADIYSLGTTMYHLITGINPFAAPSIYEIASRVLGEIPPSPHKINPKISRRMSALIMCMMRKDPDERPKTMHKLLYKLNHLYQTKPESSVPQWMQSTIVSLWNYKNVLIPLLVITFLLGGISLFLLAIIPESARRESKPVFIMPKRENVVISKSDSTKETTVSILKPKTQGPSHVYIPKNEVVLLAANIYLDIIQVPAGKFSMGSLSKKFPPEPREVNLSRNFWISKYEITQKQYIALMKLNPSTFKNNDLPVECVTWKQATDFCQKLNQITEGKRPENYVYRLPTEAEWEYACRAGTQSDFSTEKELSGLANYNNIIKKTIAVGSYAPNRWGICDMHGNVAEWCFDFYDPTPIQTSNPRGPRTGSDKIIRGGAWDSNELNCESAYRVFAPSETQSPNLGFRVVLAPPID